MSINDIEKKINPFITIILVGTLALGIIKILPVSTPKVAIGASNLTSNVLSVKTSGLGIVVASKNSKIYHLPDCPGAKLIKPTNKITFASRALAEKAGLTPAKNCKGLVVPKKP